MAVMGSSAPEPLAEAGVALLRARGFEISTWSTLSTSSRVVISLEPGAWVAKIAPREAQENMARELAIARHCAAAGAPVIAPPADFSLLCGENAVVSLWPRAGVVGEPSSAEVCTAYRALRSALDSFPEPLPDFQIGMNGAAELLRRSPTPLLSAGDRALLDQTLHDAMALLSSKRWRACALHGDAHAGNVLATEAGPRWIDFEVACRGPLEWDLSALPADCAEIEHDAARLDVCRRMRSAGIVIWCATKDSPSDAERAAIGDHLAAVRAAHGLDKNA